MKELVFKKSDILNVLIKLFMLAVLAVTAAYFAAAAETYAAEETGGTVTVDTTDDAKASARAAFNLTNNDVTSTVDGNTLTIHLKEDLVLDAPVRFVLGEPGKKVVLDLNNHTITGKAGIAGSDEEAARGGNAIEIAADEFDVEIQGPGSVIGGKGAQYRKDNFRTGNRGGCSVFFCERVDAVHGTTSQWGDIVDEGYHPEKLEHGLTIAGGAKLVGGAGADVTYDDWLSNVRGESGTVHFFASAGDGGEGIGQIFSGTESAVVLNELSYAKVVIEDGTVSGGNGGNADIGDHLFTRYDIQKIEAIQQFMADKDAGSYNFDDNVIDNISIGTGNGGNGIEFHAGRKYISVNSDGVVTGGNGGVTICSERAAMVKMIESQCGDGGSGICACGDVGLTNADASLSDEETSEHYWGKMMAYSDMIGVYIAGIVKGGSSPSTILLNDNSGRGGIGIECNLDNNAACSSYAGCTFDNNRGIVFVDSSGKVMGGNGGSPQEHNLSGGNGADAITGGSTGSPVSSKPQMKAGYFLIRGEAIGGYGSEHGGNGIDLGSESEYLDSSASSAYFAGSILGDGSVKGGDSGAWPYLPDQGEEKTYTSDNSGVIYSQNEPVCGKGIYNKYDNHPGSLTISPSLQEETGTPARLMKTDDSFKVSAEMTPFSDKPTVGTKLQCAVTKPSGYTGRVYIVWKTEIDNTTPRSVYDIEGANGAYNNFKLLGDDDYPYGIREESYGKVYKIDVGTYDRMADAIKYNDSRVVHIWCYAVLEDGRYATSNEIWFSKSRRSASGWISSHSGATAADQTAADKVAAKILLLSDPEGIGLYDESAIIQLRQEYNALTNTQKELIPQETLDRLLAAEAKVEELNQTAADAAATSINELLGTVPADLSALDLNDAAEIARVKQAIADAVTAYNNLSDSQKRLIDVDAKAKLDNAVTDFNSKFPNNAVAEPISPGVERIKLGLCKITLSKTSYTYNGKAHIPAVTVKYGDKTLTKGKDYSVKYSANKYAGKKNAAKATITGLNLYTGTATRTFTINKAANTLRIYAKTAKIKYKKVKKKTQTLGVTKVITFKRKGQGTKTYYKVSGNKKITINKKTGKVTVKKKLKKGTYKVKVKVRAAGTKNYKAVTWIVTFKVRIR